MLGRKFLIPILLEGGAIRKAQLLPSQVIEASGHSGRWLAHETLPHVEFPEKSDSGSQG